MISSLYHSDLPKPLALFLDSVPRQVWHYNFIQCKSPFCPCLSQPTNHTNRALSNPQRNNIESRMSSQLFHINKFGQIQPYVSSLYYSIPLTSIPTHVPQISVCINWKTRFFWIFVDHTLYFTFRSLLEPECSIGLETKCRWQLDTSAVSSRGGRDWYLYADLHSLSLSLYHLPPLLAELINSQTKHISQISLQLGW